MPVGTDQHGPGRGDLADERQLPHAIVPGVDEPDSILRRERLSERVIVSTFGSLAASPLPRATFIMEGKAQDRRCRRLRSGMAKLIYVANVSRDGYIEDAHGMFEWTEPTDEVFTFITDLVRPVGTYLYGRRLYETMAVWEADPTLAAQSELMADFANVWQTADKIVYSTTLHAVSTANTRLEHRFDPDSIRAIKTSAASDLTVGGPTLGAHTFSAGLVDECQLFIHPVIVGGGKPAFPSDARIQLELSEEHRFGNGAVNLRYRIQS
jgi:dihydrofolate reductase